LGDRWVVVLPEQLKRQDAGGASLRPLCWSLVAEAARGSGTGADIPDRLLDGLGRHRNLGVVGRPERDDLHNGNAQVLIAGHGRITPTARRRLALDDQIDGLPQLLL